MDPLLEHDDRSDIAFLKRFTVPEEDRRLFTTAPWDGSFRWFRSPNVIPLESARRRRQKQLPNDSDE